MTDSTGKKQRGRPADPNSGLAKARALFAGMPEGERNRKATIAKFVSDLGLSEGTSAAYFSVINRKG